jgi:hypothetical protein
MSHAGEILGNPPMSRFLRHRKPYADDFHTDPLHLRPISKRGRRDSYSRLSAIDRAYAYRSADT